MTSPTPLQNDEDNSVRGRIGSLYRAAMEFGARGPIAALALIFFFDVLLTIANPLNIDDAADKTMAREFNLLASPLYGGPDRIGQREIAIVLVDSAYLLENSIAELPMSYRNQSALLAKLSAFEPAAIFYDFYYSEPHLRDASTGDPISPTLDVFSSAESARVENSDLDEFVRQIGALQTKTPPISFFLGPVGEHVYLRPLAEYAARKRSGKDDKLQFGNAVGIEVKPDDQLEYTYPKRDENGRLQAAFALYADWCERKASRLGAREARRCRDMREWMEPIDRIYIDWGVGSAQKAQSGPDDAWNRHCEADGWKRLRLQARLVLERVGHFGVERPSTSGCSYHQYLEASALDRLPERDLRAFLKDKHVLVGLADFGFSDVVDTPVFGRVPGVYIHAMALDNLIENGPQVRRPSERFLLGANQADGAAFVLLLFAILISLAYRERKGGPGIDSNARIGGYILIVAVAAVAGFAISEAFRWPTLNSFQIALKVAGAIVIVELFSNASRVKTEEEI